VGSHAVSLVSSCDCSEMSLASLGCQAFAIASIAVAVVCCARPPALHRDSVCRRCVCVVRDRLGVGQAEPGGRVVSRRAGGCCLCAWSRRAHSSTASGYIHYALHTRVHVPPRSATYIAGTEGSEPRRTP